MKRLGAFLDGTENARSLELEPVPWLCFDFPVLPEGLIGKPDCASYKCPLIFISLSLFIVGYLYTTLPF